MACWLAGLLFALWSWSTLDFRLRLIVEGVPFVLDFVQRGLPPAWQVTPTLADALLETIQMAYLGTLLGTLLALPAAVLASRAVLPALVAHSVRAMLTALRTLPALVWALLFVAWVGLGPPAGVLALAAYTLGMLAKLYYERLDSIDPVLIEAVRQTGAHPLQVYRYGVLPQVTAHLWADTIFAFEYNVRHAAVLGIVGAGGIGWQLVTYLRMFQHDKAVATLLVMIGCVLAIDWIGGRLADRFR
jgi:phosphonate transport system permease protein